MFPVSNSSQSIIDCFVSTVQKLNIDILTGQSLQSIFKGEDYWKAETNQETFRCQKLVLTTGSNPKIWELLSNIGHNMIAAVPSLFTFNVKDKRISDLMGIASNATVRIKNTKLEASGPVLITHWGFSGPSVLRLSAWGARILADLNYQFILQINWLNDQTFSDTEIILKEIKIASAKKSIGKKAPFEIPNRLWESLVIAAGIDTETKWADLSKKQLTDLNNQLTTSEYSVNGKSTFKEEFVTAGGIDLKEVNCKTMESKIHQNLYFAGEILNIDAITGGFNFQNAWTNGFLVAEAINANKD